MAKEAKRASKHSRFDGFVKDPFHLQESWNSFRFSGPLPSELGRLTKIEKLLLRNNTLTGTIPSEWRKMGKLQNLDLRYTDLDGDFGFMCSISPDLTISIDCGGKDDRKITCSCCLC